MTTEGSSRPEWFRLLTDYLGHVIALCLLILVFSLATQHFFSADTFRTIANQILAVLLSATGMTGVLLVASQRVAVGQVCYRDVDACRRRRSFPT